MGSKLKKYDVVILSYAPTDELVFSIEKLLNQTIKPEKIVILNTDKEKLYESLTLKESFKKLLKSKKIVIKHIKKEKFDHGRTRNYATLFCSSKYILFMTDDAVPYNIYLAQNLLKGFKDYSNVATVYAKQIARPNATLKEKLIREFNYPNYDIIKEKSREKELGIKNYYCSNVCAMYDKEIFERAGEFEENIILNEDTFFVYKVINEGYKVVYKGDAQVIHSHNLSHEEQFSRNFDIGVSQKDHKEIFDNIRSEKEGMKLFKYVLSYMIKNLKFLDAIDFIIECSYRYFGFKSGYNYDRLSNEECIKYAANKDYFIRKGEEKIA